MFKILLMKDHLVLNLLGSIIPPASIICTNIQLQIDK